MVHSPEWLFILNRFSWDLQIKEQGILHTVLVFASLLKD